MNTDDLQEYADAWNAHDIRKVMSFMTDDCIFETGSGSQVYGTRFEGYDVVKARFESVWAELPDVSFENARHFVDGDRGCTQWTFKATRPDGSVMEMDGCDLFDFSNGKIRVKNSFLKSRK